MRPATALPVVGTALMVSLLAACGEDDAGTTAEDSAPQGSAAPADVTCEYPEAMEPAKPVDPPPASPTVSGEVAIAFDTSIGELTGTLDADSAPCTVNSLLSLADQGWYDDTVCHRLTTSGIFVLQCGDPTASGRGGPGYTIPDEFDDDDTFPAGTLAMANTGLPDTGGSQFFIVYDDTELSPQYTVFGSLDEASTESVRDLAADGVEGGTSDGPPATEVRIASVTTR